MHCPFKWTNSVDEEDDKCHGILIMRKKPEELASLEALDDEGEWCWPKRNSIIRCGKRVDERPIFHYLAGDDEGEQVSGGLNHLIH